MGKPRTDSESSSISHFSHPHPLQQLNHHQSTVSCSCCHLQTSDKVYGCVACNFFLHKKCSKLPKQITHPFDQDHVLYLLPKPKYPEGAFTCDACGEQGHGFCYHCETCGKDLHTRCASLSMLLTHQSHHHQLSLTFSPPYHNKSFSCDLCKKEGADYWLYRCHTCEFDVHLSCVTTIPSAPVTSFTVHNHQFTTIGSYPGGMVNSTNPTGFGFQRPIQNPMPHNFVNNPTPGVHGSVRPIGVGQAQSPAMGMPYIARPSMMNTVPQNNPMSIALQQAALAQQQAVTQQQAFLQQVMAQQQAQQQACIQQAAMAQNQALAQQQACMQQAALAQQQALMQQSMTPGNMIMNSLVEGLASSASQAATGAIIQGIFGGDGGNADGGSAYDGSFSGVDGGGGGGDVNY